MQGLTIEASATNPHKEQAISVNFFGVTLLGLEWKITGLNVVIQNSTFTEVKLSAYNVKNTSGRKFIEIDSSKIHQLKVKGGYNVTFSKCHFFDQILESIIINVERSAMNVINCTFHNLNRIGGGPSIIKAFNSKVLIRSVQWTNNYATNGLIQVSNNSQLTLENSLFRENGYLLAMFLTLPVISVKFNSSVKIQNSNFVNNSALFGGCISAGQNTTVMMYNSTFHGNTAIRGGVVHYQTIDNIRHVENVKEFRINKTESRFHFKCVIIGCQLIDNAALDDGGEVYATGRSVQITLRDNVFGSFGVVKGGSLFVT